MSPTRIEELARATADGTQIVDQYFPNSTIVTPSFGTNGPSTIIIPPGVPEIAAAHATVTDATKELHSLMLGPVAFLMNTGVYLLQCSKFWKLLRIVVRMLTNSAQ